MDAPKARPVFEQLLEVIHVAVMDMAILSRLDFSNGSGQYRCTCFWSKPVVGPAGAEEWDYLDFDILRSASSSRVCMTCQRFRYEAGRYCFTLLSCPIQQGLIPKGAHLTRRGPQRVPRRKVLLGWYPEVAQNCFAYKKIFCLIGDLTKRLRLELSNLQFNAVVYICFPVCVA